MTTTHRTLANRFEATMKRAGASVDVHYAQTGTVYVTVDCSFKVRFADHGECYCTEDMDVSPDGCTLEQAVRATAKYCALDVSRSLAAFKAAATREANRMAAADAEWAPVLAAAKAEEEKRRSFQADYLAQNCPDYASRSTKQRKRARAKANKLYEVQNA